MCFRDSECNSGADCTVISPGKKGSMTDEKFWGHTFTDEDVVDLREGLVRVRVMCITSADGVEILSD